jgi:branched-chain amino acid transport system substrate-binding protein
MQPFGEWVAKNLKYKKIATVGFDYAFGWETVSGFQRTFEESGGQIIQKIWTPLNTTDFSPFIAQIKGDADAVFAVFFGRESLQFVKQYADSGLKAKIPLLGNGTVTDESVLPQMGDEALNVYTALHYSAALNKVELKDFPRGPVVIDKWGNPVQNVYIRKVERVGGQLQNSVIFTYPAVSQFWKYNPRSS